VRVVLDFEGVTDSKFLVDLARGALELCAAHNRFLFRSLPFPPLYESGIRFRPEPWAGRVPVANGRGGVRFQKGVEQFANAAAVLRRGWGDCAQLCAYRIAERREQGQGGDFYFWKRNVQTPDGMLRNFHVMVKQPGGFIEDPSRYLSQ